ncbi:MAG: HDIG domain-containing metalloprotein [Chloroflexota bacterium]
MGKLILGLSLIILTALLLVIQLPLSEKIGLSFALISPQLVFNLLGLVALVTLMGLVIRLYLLQFRQRLIEQGRYFWLLFLLLLLFLGLARVLIPADSLILPYFFPMATLSIMLAVLFDVQFSILITVLGGFIVGYLADPSLEFTLYPVVGGLIGVLSLGREERLSRLLRSGGYVSLSNMIVGLIFHLSADKISLTDLSTILLAAGVNGLLSAALAFIGFFLVGQFFGITTSLQLLELARPTQPLLRHLLLRAPGTYHHTLLVSNLAEQAAERIGADAFLTRVGAYYHDIGKIKRPYFFIENQLHGINVQEQLEPQVSAQIIISHVEDGLELAKKYGLPRDIRAFIAEHHGTSLVKYFYQQALEQADNADEVQAGSFRYAGPKPQRKETAIVMLADSCEAAVRALTPASIDELAELIRRIITGKLSDGELDECDLTISDLEQIRRTFVEMLQGVSHRRIEYPPENKEKPVEPHPSSQAVSPAPLLNPPSDQKLRRSTTVAKGII